MASARQTTDHDEIREWVESKGGRPAEAEGTEVLRVDFDGHNDSLEPIEWDAFFEIFDENNLAFLYDPDGRMNKFIQREGTSPGDDGKVSTRGGSRKKSGGRNKTGSSSRKKSGTAERKKPSAGGRKASGSSERKEPGTDGRKKSSSDGRKKSSSDGRKKSSSDGRKKSSSDGRKKSSSDGRKKSSSGGRKKSSTDGRKKSGTGGRKKSSTDGRKKSSAGGRKKSTASDGRKKSGRKYSEKASRKVGDVMHEYGEGKLRSGGSGRKVKNRKQAIAIGISEARREGDRVPESPGRKKSSGARKRKKS